MLTLTTRHPTKPHREDQYKQKTSYYEELLANTVANQSK